jgi:cation diffusion facilitator family transporter
VAKIEGVARKVEGVEEIRVSIATGTMSLRTANGGALTRVEDAVEAMGYRLNRLDLRRTDSDGSPAPSHVTPAYKRALWTVVVLNVGYGAVEFTGGLLADSQALKADALDFFGDGFITLLGLVAVGWSLAWRARSALLQGLFLGALGFGVLMSTGYQLLVGGEPEAGLMGGFAFVALIVNLAAAAVLVPHRTGDANARAVWLFSRNDAIGNVAVIGAAGLVAWTGTAWPDYAVALVMAGLFINSAWSIVRDARRDLEDGQAVRA